MGETNTGQLTVECACGKRLKAPASAVGKRAKCPGCGTILTIEAPPPPESVDDDFDALYEMAAQESEAATRQESTGGSSMMRCPSCSSPLAVGAVICIQCGYDMRTRAKVKPESAAPPATATKKGAARASAPAARRNDDIESTGESGNYFVGLAYGLAFGVVGAIVCFLVWYKLPNLPFTGWLVLLIGALTGKGVDRGYRAGTHFAGASAAAITFLIVIVTKFGVLAAFVAPAISQAIDEASIDRDDRVLEMLADEEAKKGNVNPEKLDFRQMAAQREVAAKRLKEMPESEYKALVQKADAEEEKEELVESITEEVLKERGLNPETSTDAQDELAEKEATKRVEAMTPSQRTTKLAAARHQSEAELEKAMAKARAERSASKSKTNASNADDDESSGSSTGSLVGFAILMFIGLFIWAMLPSFVAMSVAWRIAANS